MAEHDNTEENDGFEDAQETPSSQPERELPADLPRSLDDRREVAGYVHDTEYYDAWQGPSGADILRPRHTY